MSSPIFASAPSSGVSEVRHRSSSFGAPRLDLVLRPSYALGPFKLGHSLWHVLNYLRSNQSLFPQINITYDETTPRRSPLVVLIQPNLHLIFNGQTQRLVMITLENLDSSATGTSQATSHSAGPAAFSEPSHRPVNLIYNGKLIFSRGSARSPSVALNRSTLHQILGPTYPGRPESSFISSDSLVALASSSRRIGADKEHSEFILTYPGVAFCFVLKPDGAKNADVDKFQPVASMHVFSGTDPNNPDDVLAIPSPVQSSEGVRPAARAFKSTLSPTAAVGEHLHLNSERDRAALDIDAIQVRCPALLDAEITPGQSVSLHFAKSGVSRAISPTPDRSVASASPNRQTCSHPVELVLGVTTPQDAMCELGQPQRIFYKEDDRMRIHGASAGHAGGHGARERVSENPTLNDDTLANTNDTDDSAFFYNYFDLGIDLLFSTNTLRMRSVAEAYDAVAAGQPRLEKVVCHTNVPGDALFQRYNRCPWRVSSWASSDKSTATKPTSKSKTTTSTTAAFSFQDHFDSTLSTGQDDRGMELDRGTCAEFKGSRGVSSAGLDRLKSDVAGRRQASTKRDASESSPEREHNSSSELMVDLSTRLVGRQGMVLEVAKDGSMVGVVVF